jgi:chitin disaccharide deacetylase
MLIVNADDLGRSVTATNSAITCYKNKRLSSATAMMFMKDSERAAELALESGLSVGLHLNFSEPFDNGSTPDQLLESQHKIGKFLTANKYFLLIYNPFLKDEFRFVFETQLEEFIRLFGRQPSHFDGHHHLHLATNMLLQKSIPQGSKVRRSFSFNSGEKSFFNRFYRNLVDNLLLNHYITTDYFYSISNHMSIEKLQRILDLNQNAKVELMVHPERHEEFEFLMSDDYARTLSHVTLGSYDNL